MLRSRGNRQQRPSESTDEQHGSSGAGYYGYPSSRASASSPALLGVARGDADDYVSPAKGGGPSRFGFGGSGGGGGGSAVKRRAPSSGGISFSNRHNGLGASAARLRNDQGSRVGSGGLILCAMALVLTAALGGVALHYQRAIARVEHELRVVERRLATERPRARKQNLPEDGGAAGGARDPAAPRVDPEVLHELRAQQRELQKESGQWQARLGTLSGEIKALTAHMEHLSAEGAEARDAAELALLQKTIEKEREQGQAHKKEFQDTHKEGKGGIVPGGAGHALVQSREIAQMQSLKDYEVYVTKREDALWDKIDLLIEKYGTESKREAEEWFGPGPHFVDMEIEYPKYTEGLPPAEWPKVRGVVQLEMAPLDQMPVAVNMFLQQVHHQLWNGCSFVINAIHIIQAGPHRHKVPGEVTYDANVADLHDRFHNARLTKMPFQEYHAEFPHARYTVGFAGRPAGPDFYINKIDNSVNHGPGGQAHHDLHEEADPCFAKVVGGAEVLEDLDRVPMDRDQGYLLLYPVEIVQARVRLRHQITEPVTK